MCYNTGIIKRGKMQNLFDEFGNAEIENLADEWEEQQAILREENDFHIGDEVVLTDTSASANALFGIGVHTVQEFKGTKIKIKLWHGKRSIWVNLGEIAHFNSSANQMVQGV